MTAIVPSVAGTGPGKPSRPAPRSLSAQGMGVVRTVARRFTYPVEAPITSISLYYLALIGVAIPLVRYVPALHGAFSGVRLEELAAGGTEMLGGAVAALPAGGLTLSYALLLAVAMIGAFLLMVPATWVYMATRNRKGFDQGVVQTMLLLALSVAGVIVIVRSSIALAFSLAGIVGAVRYRNNLPETRDTLFIFLAIGVGLAAGVGSLPAAAALSMVFCYMVLIMARMDYGMCELGRSSTHLLHRPAPVPAPDDPRADKKARKAKDDFNAVLVVRALGAEAGRKVVEPFLDQQTKRWSLAEVEGSDLSQRVHLKYLLRVGRKRDTADLEDAILEAGRPHLIGARIH